MKKPLKIFLVVIISLIFAYFIGNSSIGNSRLGVELPIGWRVDSISEGPCNADDLGTRGIPLASWRQSSDSCGSDINTLATVVNYLTAVIIGIGVYRALDKSLR